MAYLSGDSLAHGEVTAVADAARFSPLELRVIGLGERVDVSRERRPDSRLARALHWLFGFTAAGPLADPRLETLRRFASKARFRRAAFGEDDIEALVAAGFTAGQAWGLLGYLAARPNQSVEPTHVSVRRRARSDQPG